MGWTSAPFARRSRIFIAGHQGMVRSTLLRREQAGSYGQMVTRTRSELDLLGQRAVHAYLAEQRRQYRFTDAAKVGGIQVSHTYSAHSLCGNLKIQDNIVRCTDAAGVQRLILLVSSCIDLRDGPHRMREGYLLTGPLAATNEPFGTAGIAGIKLCENFNHQHGRQYAGVMPTNLYGPDDNDDLADSHVLPTLVRKTREAREPGNEQHLLRDSGMPRREFLYADDRAGACVHLMEAGYDGTLGNIGTGENVTIRELAETVMEVEGFRGRIVSDASKPEGTPRQRLDASRLASAGWHARMGLQEGIWRDYAPYASPG